MFAAWKNWRDARRVRKMGYTRQEWEAASDWPLMARFAGEERMRCLICRCAFWPASIASGGGFAYTDAMCLKVADHGLCADSVPGAGLV